MTYRDARFEGSKKHGRSRRRLAFDGRVVRLGEVRDDWDFVEDPVLRANIAAELQKVHFDVLLLNEYNVYYGPEAMTLKHAIVALASVAEAVLELQVKMLLDDPKVQALLVKRDWVFEEIRTLSAAGIDVPDGIRIVSGVQREVVRDKFDRNTKMELLIRAAKTGDAVDANMAKRLNRLRDLRNRVHIKTVEELEYEAYEPETANEALGILEDYRIAAKAWIESPHSHDIGAILARRIPSPAIDPGRDLDEPGFEAVPDFAPDDDIPF